MDKRVFLCRTESYQYDLIRQNIDLLFEKLELADMIQPGMRVAIKPNLIMKSKPDAAIITHPLVVAAVGNKVKELGASVLIAESSGGLYTPAVLKSTYNECGYREIAEKYGFELNYDCSYTEIFVPEGQRCKTFQIINPLLNADLIIDVAKLKSHCMTGLSGAVKNMFGSVPGLLKPELHCRFPDKQHFGEMLVDLCERMTPRICIVDAVLAMEGNGPTGGRPKHMGLIYGGTSPYCVDLVSTYLIGMQPNDIYMMRSAIQRGLCPAHMLDLDLMGEDPKNFYRDDFLQPESKSNDFITRVPKIFQPIAYKLTTPRPKIRKSDCVGCGKCAESCPQHTIEIVNRKAKIHYDQCIKCYCCHEMCPIHAVDIKRFSLFSL